MVEFSAVLLKVALLNLVTISSTWARIIDVMDSEVSMLQCRDLEDYRFCLDYFVCLRICI